MSDQIANMLNIIKNGQSVLKYSAEVPFSKIKYEILKIFEREGFIEKVESKGKKNKKVLEVILKYKSPDESGKKIPAISGIKKISKSGQRIYLPHQKIKIVKDGYGISIVSTSRGLLIDKEARKQKVGGEVICQVW